MAPKSIPPPYIPLQSISSLLPSKCGVAVMEEHKSVVPARKSKCVVPAMKSKVEVMAAGVPIYGGGGNNATAVAAAMAWWLDLALLIRPYLTTTGAAPA
jgi:hypothetical protein